MTPDRPERKNPRLRGWDYGAGGTYFVTFCTSAHRPVLSSIRRGDPCGRPPLVLTPLGNVWQSPSRLPEYGWSTRLSCPTMSICS
ncbi:hypothetical protein M5E87_08195 [Flavonifractor plautii]|nr:hypothetical protein M5E87_08195 [Flavonifractor plautii]